MSNLSKILCIGCSSLGQSELSECINDARDTEKLYLDHLNYQEGKSITGHVVKLSKIYEMQSWLSASDIVTINFSGHGGMHENKMFLYLGDRYNWVYIEDFINDFVNPIARQVKELTLNIDSCFAYFAQRFKANMVIAQQGSSKQPRLKAISLDNKRQAAVKDVDEVCKLEDNICLITATSRKKGSKYAYGAFYCWNEKYVIDGRESQGCWAYSTNRHSMHTQIINGRLAMASATATGYKYNRAKSIVNSVGWTSKKTINGLGNDNWRKTKPIWKPAIAKVTVGKRHSGLLFHY